MFKAKDHAEVFNQISDHPRTFPEEALKLLERFHLLIVSLPKVYQLETIPSGHPQNMWNALFEVGRANLSVGRIFEGHINALLLIETFGSDKQKTKYFSRAAEGKIFGIWNTERPFEGLHMNEVGPNLKLFGAKTFCSGALNIQHPIVTAKTKDGTQMVILDLDDDSGLIEDWSLWNPIGMCASVSCRIDFTDYEISRENMLGTFDDYYKDPYFSWGAVRFSVVQLGCAKAIVDSVVAHLNGQQRSNNPYQKMRLGKLAILMETADLWLKKASAIDEDHDADYSDREKVNFSNMMRTVTSEICEHTIALAEKSVGIQGVMRDHPLEQLTRDLRVYLKQAGPDAALANIGTFIAEH